ncbi:odorant receptor Or2-like [Sabethes cyaneus]|uniref:odorant receptor Or2-like n=1 Tax=Sabethes cyaneus TaxID=53552 RepID=UPI00237EA201|nr:odorant receptor Or2-like [Sabethes cyaneus]
MNVLNCPIISTNVRVFRFFSFMLKEDAMCYVWIIPVAIIDLFMFTNIYYLWGYFEVWITNAFLTILLFNATAIEDLAVQRIITSLTKRARMLTFCNYGLAMLVDVCILAYPLYIEERKLPFEIYVPFMDVRKSPSYEIAYAIQALWLIPANCMYIPLSNFFFSATLFGLIQIKTLQHQLTVLKANTLRKCSINLNLTINKIIEDHLRIITYIEDINSLLGFICLVEFLLFEIMICVLLYHIFTTNNYSQIIVSGCYIFGATVELFAVYWHANEVREESVRVAEAAYNGSWIDMDKSAKKKLLLISLRAQRPLEIKLGNVFPITLEMFQSLLNTSYSYCTLLRRFNN